MSIVLNHLSFTVSAKQYFCWFPTQKKITEFEFTAVQMIITLIWQNNIRNIYSTTKREREGNPPWDSKIA